jgi:creatinine amidohydrolase
VSAVLWQDAAWPDLQQVLRTRPTEVGLLPIGATEQHGPHLPTGTDTLIATAVCERAAALVGGIVLPAVPVGVSYGHGTELPGTLSLSPALLAEVLKAQVAWAAASGLRRLLLVNAHLGNTATIGTATDWLRLHAPELRVGSVDWWAASPELTAEVTADGKDIHANRAETAVVMAVAPHLVWRAAIADADDEDRTAGLVFRYTAPSLSTNGVTGRPSEATAELGERLLDLAAAAVADRIERGRTEEPPLGVAARPRLAV